jgi:hypothetical protein
MSCVYLVNVGSNTSHSTRARSPVFSDGSFKYVPFPYRTARGSELPDYTKEVRSFVRMDRLAGWATHADPDWKNLTYGDICSRGRAGALQRVQANDTLLFWGLLWENAGKDWSGFTGSQAWYLLGAIRVQDIVADRASLARLAPRDQARARANAHLDGGNELERGHRIFLGEVARSTRFQKAVDLGAARGDGLLYRSLTAADGSALAHGGRPPWSSSLRACRRMWDLSNPKDRARAKLVQRAIARVNDYDLFAGAVR